MVPTEFQQPPNNEATRNWVWVNGEQFFKVDHAANIRMGTTVDYPTLFQYALDTLAIPATATECESTFSSAKKLVTPERDRLADDVIEACKCLKAWWECGVIKPRY